MSLNLLALLACLAVAIFVTLLVVIVASSRVRKHGVMGTLRGEFSVGTRMRTPYKG